MASEATASSALGGPTDLKVVPDKLTPGATTRGLAGRTAFGATLSFSRVPAKVPSPSDLPTLAGCARRLENISQGRGRQDRIAEPRDSMGRAARTWQLRRCNLTDGVPRCPSRTT